MLRKMIACSCVLAFSLAGCERTTVEGPANKKLTLTKPASVTIRQGETEKINIGIDRDNFTGAVSLKFERMPAGVDVADATREISGDDATFVLTADQDASLVENHSATVTAEGPDGMKVTEAFTITVKPKG